SLKYPTFNGCKEALEPSFCYLIQETKLKECDTLPLIYEWDFGDGTSARGLSVEHCFPDFGDYDVKLNVFDSITGHHFAAVSELYVSIERPDYPIFELPDTVKINESIALELNKTYVDFMEVKECFWFDQKDLVGEGERYEWSSALTGEHWLKVGLLSELTAAGYEQSCAYRKVVVVEDSPEFEQIEARRLEPELTAMQPRSSPRFFNDLGQRKPIVYFVELKSSLKQIPLSDPYFENVSYPITERYEFADSSFHYSVGEVSEISQLYRIYKQMINAGYDQSLVMDRTAEEFDRSFVKRGMYFPEEVKSEMNTQMNKLSDIQFDTDSHVITKESYNNLQKVVEVMMLEPEIQLLVKAHTDDRGSDTHNQTLSEKRAQAVKEFLISKGISKNRIQCLGFGNTQPIDDNKHEAGRARNRRVEFEILFEIMEKEKNKLPMGNRSAG
ncbi:MAG: OmpA family protein, partial [Flavobacteriales bacterium]|nr:OmpA family protein [Flavobacteriales bacterium]